MKLPAALIILAAQLSSLPAFDSPPEKTRPPVLLIAGQSREEFSDYVSHVSVNGEACALPGGAAFYTNLDLDGFKSPHSNVPGDHNQDLEFLKLSLDPLVFQVGLWLSAEQLNGIVSGDFEAQINGLYESLSALKRPVFLRIGYEFDGPHNRYEPDVYVRAYRVIAKAMRQNRDILLVWHSFAMLPTYKDIPVEEWYPGNDVVDWIGISFFQVGTEGFHREPNRTKLIEIARSKGKPVLIGEASAIRYTRRQKTLTGQAYWDYWYKPYFEFIEANPEIRAAGIIDVNWDSQAQHKLLEWGDCRIDSDPVVLKNWRAKMAEKYWLPRSSALYQDVRNLK
jgi:hypothetical protein